MINRYSVIILFSISFLFFSTYYGQVKNKTNTSKKNSINTSSVRPEYDEIYHAKLVDLVVVGEVVKIANVPGPSSELFHSEAVVRIDSILKGKANFHYVILLRMSGPITDKGISPNISVDAHFTIGEKGIYFLRRPEKDNFLTAPFIQRGLYSLHQAPKKDDNSVYKTSFYGKKTLNELPDSVFWGDHVCRDIIKNDSVQYRWGTFNIKTVTKEIKTLQPVINH